MLVEFNQYIKKIYENRLLWIMKIKERVQKLKSSTYLKKKMCKARQMKKNVK